MREDIYSYICALPTETVLHIFTYLPVKELIKCRQVCLRLKLIVDGLIRSDNLWRKHCKIDYPKIYKIARYQSKPGLLWYNIYKSLTLWPKLASTRVDWDEFASASSVNEEISNFKILRDGNIGVHTRSGIFYYDIETLKRTDQKPVTGDYLRYTENDDSIAVLSYQLMLFIIKKIIKNPNVDTNVSFPNVKTFILVDQAVYFVTLSDEICECKLEDLTHRVIRRSEDGVMTLGYSNGMLNVLSFQRNIYTVTGSNLVFACELGPESNLLHCLYEYNFLETIDWRVYNQWMYILNHYIPDGPLRDIITIRMYGEVVFVGSNWGVLRIYYAPFSAGEFNLYKAEPTKQFNFMERNDCPVLSLCPIIQIDVSESEDGHTVIVAMPKKIAVLNFTHNFKRTASVAMLPYKEEQKIKSLRIEDCM